MGKAEYQKVLEAKKKAKMKLMGDSKNIREPLVLVFAKSKEKDLLFELLEGFMVLPSHVVVVSDAEPGDSVKHPTGKITWLNPQEFEKKNKVEEYLFAADMAVLFAEPHRELQDLMKHGVVVIGHEKSPMLADYHPLEETGNGFTFASYNPWAMFMATVRAHETYRFPYDWMNIVRVMLKGL
ncbi:hypothetical protein IT413_01405 [Candidatus Peregrinibacteria bacterium]|nr:hypothetical protein [Candidatus Peregrinibacteria bacterium]